MTLIEIVLAMLLVSVTALLMANAFTTGGRISLTNEERIIATGLARELIEEVKSRPFGEAVGPASAPAGFEKFNCAVQAEFVNAGNFNEVSPVETDFIRVTATVSAPNIQDVVLTTVVGRLTSPAE